MKRIIQTINVIATNNKTVCIPDQSSYIVLYFYPKDSTSGCTQEGLDFTKLHQNFIEHNIIIYGVSRDSIKCHEHFKNKQSFTFDLISDEDEYLCNLFNVIALKKLYGREYLGIVRSTFVISPNGEVIKHWDKVNIKNHAQEVLDFVKHLPIL